MHTTHSEYSNKVARNWIDISGNASWAVVILPPSCSEEAMVAHKCTLNSKLHSQFQFAFPDMLIQSLATLLEYSE